MDGKRVIAIFVVTWVSAALLSPFLYKKTREPQIEKTVMVLAPKAGIKMLFATILLIFPVFFVITLVPSILTLVPTFTNLRR